MTDVVTGVVIGIDPGARSSGLAFIDPGERLRWPPRTLAAGWRSEAELVDELDQALGPATWAAAVERPFNRRGPVWADRAWRRVLKQLAKRRAERASVRFRNPFVLRPWPQTWRGAMGINRLRSLHRCDCKEAARAWLEAADYDAEALADLKHDACEAAVIGAWAAAKLSVSGTLWVP